MRRGRADTTDPGCADAGRHGRRGYVCGPRALRRAADPHQLVRGCFSLAASQLSRAGRLSPWRCAGCGRQAVLQPGAGAFARAARRAGDASNGHRLPGADLRLPFPSPGRLLGSACFPGFVRHTHPAHPGQIYIPFVNWGCTSAASRWCSSFGSSRDLAAAYGLAVAGVMLVASAAMVAIARRYWDWGTAQTTLVWGPLTAVNGALLVACSLKFLEGGVVPLESALRVSL